MSSHALRAAPLMLFLLPLPLAAGLANLAPLAHGRTMAGGISWECPPISQAAFYARIDADLARLERPETTIPELNADIAWLDHVLWCFARAKTKR